VWITARLRAKDVTSARQVPRWPCLCPKPEMSDADGLKKLTRGRLVDIEAIKGRMMRRRHPVLNYGLSTKSCQYDNLLKSGEISSNKPLRPALKR
jgi:hypothetical protein